MTILKEFYGSHCVQILTDKGYVAICLAKEIDGERYFKFQEVWHKVNDYK